MLTGIQTLKSFGIFDEYTRPAGMKDFCDRNVIYGWNYSGKTTLSRLFHAPERIVNLLNSEAIQIEVVPDEGVDRFILKRNGRIAKHLSEGEKTAIAFAFFLTKLP